jgi:ribokinase
MLAAMRILNYGSLNIDHVYAVDHLVRPGETLGSLRYSRFAGGKGNNQSVALARAGASVCHAGRIGADGVWLRDGLAACGVDVSRVRVCDVATGHAVIQVDRAGQNAIVLHGGANRAVTAADAEGDLAGFGPGDWLLLQNEIAAIPDIVRLGSDRGMRVAFNPAPMHADVLAYPLERVSCFLLNEIEGSELTGVAEPDGILIEMRRRFPAAMTVLTLGARGARCVSTEGVTQADAVPVTAVDTTAAGDTFIGYFLADVARGAGTKVALRAACEAAALCVTRPGAADSIPTRAELAAWRGQTKH